MTISKNFKDYPYNLIDDIFNITRDESGIILNDEYKDILQNLSDAQIDGLEYGLSILSDTIQLLIRYHYIDKYTYSEIARKINRTPGSVKSEIDRGLKKFRNSRWRKIKIIKGYHPDGEIYKILENKLIDRTSNRNDIHQAIQEISTIESKFDIKLFDLYITKNMSGRLYNDLVRYGFQTLGDIWPMSKFELISLNGFDMGYVNEINDIMIEYIGQSLPN